MANALFAAYREAVLLQSTNVPDWDGHNIKCVLQDHGTDNPNVATDDFLDDISTGVVATSGNLSGKTGTGGVADADDVTFTAVSGASIESIVIYRDTGTASTSMLIAKIDTATGLPLTPSGGDVTITWDSGSSKIFKL